MALKSGVFIWLILALRMSCNNVMALDGDDGSYGDDGDDGSDATRPSPGMYPIPRSSAGAKPVGARACNPDRELQRESSLFRETPLAYDPDREVARGCNLVRFQDTPLGSIPISRIFRDLPPGPGPAFARGFESLHENLTKHFMIPGSENVRPSPVSGWDDLQNTCFAKRATYKALLASPAGDLQNSALSRCFYDWQGL